MSISDKFVYHNYEYVKGYCEKTSLRNNFSDDVFIVVIGHLKYINELITFYKGIKNVVFVVDKTETKENIKSLEDNNFKVIVSNTPSFNGYGNVNFQCDSSLTGAEYLKSINGKYMIRMRSDQIILQLSDFINNFKFDKLGFISYVYQKEPHQTVPNFDSFNNHFCEKMGVDKNFEKLCYCYLMDYCISGPVDEMIKLFDYQESQPILAPAEHKILMNYFIRTNQPLDNSYENIKDKFYLMTKAFVENKIDFIMLKQGYHNWSIAIPLQPSLYFIN